MSALAGGFLVTYWLTEPAPEPVPEAAVAFAGVRETGNRLANSDVSSSEDLRTAAQNAGLRASSDFKGFVEQIRRVGETAEISGWVADLRGIGEPSQLYFFAGGRLAGQAETRGERKDVTRTLNLAGDEKNNVNFSTALRCRTGDVVRVIAVNPYGHYFVLNSERCP
ncbi:MAG: hypothetical protein ABW175_07770 [Bradyrhizobium sp.]